MKAKTWIWPQTGCTPIAMIGLAHLTGGKISLRFDDSNSEWNLRIEKPAALIDAAAAFYDAPMWPPEMETFRGPVTRIGELMSDAEAAGVDPITPTRLVGMRDGELDRSPWLVQWGGKGTIGRLVRSTRTLITPEDVEAWLDQDWLFFATDGYHGFWMQGEAYGTAPDHRGMSADPVIGWLAWTGLQLVPHARFGWIERSAPRLPAPTFAPAWSRPPRFTPWGEFRSGGVAELIDQWGTEAARVDAGGDPMVVTHRHLVVQSTKRFSGLLLAQRIDWSTPTERHHKAFDAAVAGRNDARRKFADAKLRQRFLDDPEAAIDEWRDGEPTGGVVAAGVSPKLDALAESFTDTTWTMDVEAGHLAEAGVKLTTWWERTQMQHLAAGRGDAAIAAAFPGVPVPPEFWRTEAGRLLAADKSLRCRSRMVTHAEAADVLGVTKGTVAQLAARRSLPSSRDGIPLGFVLDRLVAAE